MPVRGSGQEIVGIERGLTYLTIHLFDIVAFRVRARTDDFVQFTIDEMPRVQLQDSVVMIQPSNDELWEVVRAVWVAHRVAERP